MLLCLKYHLMGRKVFWVFLFILCWVGVGFGTTFYLTNGVIEIFNFVDAIKGQLYYDPYKAKITVVFGTNTIEFFENREFYIVNSNYIFPMIGGLIKSNYNYYISFSVVDSIVSFFRISSKVENFVDNVLPYDLKDVENKNIITKSNNVSISQPSFDTSKDNQTTIQVSDTNFVPIKFVIIDAGHGGKDPGAIHNGVKEKDLTLKYAKSLHSELSKILTPMGIRVVLTRSSDVYLTLEQRVKVANELLKNTKGYGIFISIHMNASPIRSKKGMEIYYVSDQAVDDNTREVLALENSFIPKDEIRKVSDLEKVVGKIRSVALMEESRILGERITKFFTNNILLKGAPFYVIKYIPIPSILLEIGYISNQDEAKFLLNDNNIDSISKSLAGGILEFINEYNRTKGFTSLR